MARLWGLVLGLGLCLALPSGASVWQIESLDESGIGRYSSLKRDGDGNLHVVYITEDGKYSLKYGFWDHKVKRWFNMKVAEGASFSSLTLDSKNRPHISWADHGTGVGSRLRYIYWSGQEWIRRPIPLDAETVAYYTSIALDKEDKACISFYEYNGPKGTDFRVRLRAVMWNGSFWEVKTIDGENQSGKFNATAIDSRGQIHIAYANVGAMTAGMRYALWDGKSWKREVLEGLLDTDRAYVGTAANIALDQDGNPHVTYMNESTGMVKYAVRKGGRWQIEVVDRVARVAYPDRNAIAIDENGQPYLSYHDRLRGTLNLAYKKAGKWYTEVVDSDGSGFTSSLQVSHGAVWISYADERVGGLKIAHLDPEAQNSSAPAQATAAGPKQNER